MIRSSVLAIFLLASATPAQAASAQVEKAYATCLEKLIATKGIGYAVNHAGSTRCEKEARRSL